MLNYKTLSKRTIVRDNKKLSYMTSHLMRLLAKITEDNGGEYRVPFNALPAISISKFEMDKDETHFILKYAEVPAEETQKADQTA
jgi:hypothetical protein